jgi:predicted kinase
VSIQTIHLMSGLPASGKTAAARRLLADSAGRIRRVNLDDLRAMLDHDGTDQPWSREHEQTALATQDAAVRAAIDGGFDLVVDNTHLTPRIPKRLKAAVAGRARFVLHDLTHVPIEECLRRDADRPCPVGPDVIHRLAEEHKQARRGGWRLTEEWLNDTPPIAPYVPDPQLPPAVMCDIDGTLAINNSRRGPYDFTRCGEDDINDSVRWVLRRAHRTYARIVLLSGRGEEHRPRTEKWLYHHRVPYHELWMRPAGDTRRDDIVKAGLFDAHVRNRYRVRVSLDDRDRVVDLWRRIGLPTWQVAPGNF